MITLAEFEAMSLAKKDEYIGVHVMGAVITGKRWGIEINGVSHRSMPHYSTDINESIQLLESMSGYRIEKYGSTGKYQVIVHLDGNMESVIEKPLTRAIRIAVLRIKGAME